MAGPPHTALPAARPCHRPVGSGWRRRPSSRKRIIPTLPGAKPGQDAQVAGGKGGAGPSARREEKGKTMARDKGPAEADGRRSVGRESPDPTKSPGWPVTGSAEWSTGAARSAPCAGPRQPDGSTTASRVTWPEWARAGGLLPGGGEGSAGPGSAARPRRPRSYLPARSAGRLVREPPTAPARAPARPAAGRLPCI